MNWIVLYIENDRTKLWISDNATKAVDFLMYLKRQRMDRSIMYGVDEIVYNEGGGLRG